MTETQATGARPGHLGTGTTFQNPTERRAARRVKALREEKGLTQQALAAEMGFANRQSLASIEAGERGFSPEEIQRAAKALGVDPETLTDPYQLIGEGRFNFRIETASSKAIREFRAQSGSWIATYRELGTRLGKESSSFGRTLELTEGSSFEDAQAAGEFVGQFLGLGDRPASKLGDAIRDRLEILVLQVEMPHGLSGAALHLPGSHAILINRHEPLTRRSFNLAHELFHVLTWDRMPPPDTEQLEASKAKGNRVEYLANNFAASLLMPEALLRAHWSRRGAESLEAWATRTTTHFAVSGDALGWRLCNMGLIAKNEVSIVAHAGSGKPNGEKAQSLPLPFSAEFANRIYDGIVAGMLSIRRASAILGIALHELDGFFGAYNLVLDSEQ